MRLTTIIATCAALLLTACSEPEAEPPAPPRVRIAPLSELQITIEYTAPAQALSKHDTVLSAELASTVTAVPADVGEHVEATTPLIELDCRDALAAREQAEATLAALKAREALARQQFDRARSLRASRSISMEELNQKESALEAAAAERRAQASRLEVARRDADRCTVTAPFSGVLTERHVQVGERVAPGTPLIRLVDTGNLEVHAAIAAGDAGSLNGETEPVFVHEDRRYPVRLRSLAAAIDPKTQTQPARLEFTAGHPRAGTRGQLAWTDPRPALPPHLISKRENRYGILLAENNQAVFHPLPDALPGRPAFVDLPADSPVITDGRLGLQIGETFEVNGSEINEAGSDGAAGP